MKKRKQKLVPVHYMEDVTVKAHADSSKEGLSKWLRSASKVKLIKETKKKKI